MTAAVSQHLRVLPAPTRRGLSRAEAAEYIGVGTSKFDEMIADGRMPHAKRIDGRKVWDVRAIDKAFERLPSDNRDEHNPWDN
jgi:excisionase family DNA binding protein